VADSGGPHAGVAAWLTVLVIVAGFIVGVVALIAHNNPIIWGAAVVVLVIGGVLGLASRIMELGH
jgi:hypothetical protein